MTSEFAGFVALEISAGNSASIGELFGDVFLFAFTFIISVRGYDEIAVFPAKGARAFGIFLLLGEDTTILINFRAP